MTKENFIDDAEDASMSVAEVSEMATAMNETYEKMMRIPKHLYGEYYLYEKAKHDARPVMMRYNGWKMHEWDETFESLKDRLVFVVAAFLTARPLRFSRKPNLREIEAVQLELVKNSLPRDFAYCEDFKEMCARFRKFNRWEGHIMKLDYNRYGKYLLQNYYKMTDEERQAFFDLDIMVEMINEDIRRLKPNPSPSQKGGEEEPQQLPLELSTVAAMALWKKAQAAGWVDANYQPTISRTQAALLADAMAERLKIGNKWKVFETLWKRKNMSSDYTRALSQIQSLSFQDKIKALFVTGT